MFHHLEKNSIGTTIMGERGQIVIPLEVRESLKLKKGDKLLVFTKHKKFIGLLKVDEVDQMIDHITGKFAHTINKIREKIKEN